MRPLLLIFGLFLCFGQIKAQSSQLSPPSDATAGYTYDFDLVKKMIIDHQLAPNADNALAKPIIESKDFPKLSGKSALNKEYHEKLGIWIEKHPTLIIETFKSRKDIVHPFGN